MKLLKRSIALILILLMAVPLIVSCNKAEEAPDGGVTSSAATSEIADTTDASQTTSKYDVDDGLSGLDYNGRTVKIANTSRSWFADEISVERFTGDIVNDAVYRRNFTVAERLNIKLENVQLGTGNYAVSSNLRENYEAGIHAYDLISSPVYATIAYTGEGIFRDMNGIDELDLTKPYWSQYFNEAVSVGDAQYMATGAISLSYYRFIFATFVNDSLLNTRSDAPDLMSVVKNKEWTLEYQTQLAANYYSSKSGGGTPTEQDTFGLVTSDWLNIDPYWSSCDITILKKTQDNWYEYGLDVNRLSTATDRIISLLGNKGTFCYKIDNTDETGNGEQASIAEKFASGTALMATLRLYDASNAAMRDMKDEYTILPLPMYDSDQEDYFSFLHDSFTGVAVPATGSKDDLPMCGAVLEVMASESYREVTPAYYETTLKSRYFDDEASWEMLDMISTNVKVDAGVIYSRSLDKVFQSLRGIVSGAVRDGKANTVSSKYSDSRATTIKGLLDTLQSDIKKIQTKQ